MSDNKFTSVGLVAHAEKALKEKWFYGWGAWGKFATKEYIDQLCANHSSNEKWRTYMMGAVTAGTRLCDCYGLVESYFWWIDDKSNPKYNSNGITDTNTANAYNKAKEKEKGPLSTLPEVPGIILYMPGHVGVYCGKGRFIELQGGGIGAYEGKITNGKITKGSKFTHWFKDINIDYSEEQEEAEMRYKTLAEIKADNIATDAVQAIEAAIAAGKRVNKNGLNLVGGIFADLNNLNISRDMIITIIFNYRAGLYDY